MVSENLAANSLISQLNKRMKYLMNELNMNT